MRFHIQTRITNLDGLSSEYQAKLEAYQSAVQADYDAIACGI